MKQANARTYALMANSTYLHAMSQPYNSIYSYFNHKMFLQFDYSRQLARDLLCYHHEKDDNPSLVYNNWLQLAI